jgi:hypothetical protein
VNQPIPNPPPPSIHPSQESLVIPTSDFHPAPAVSSQLPPSDPPSSTPLLPTSTPESAKKRRHGAVADDADESPLNPLKKRKRQRVVMDKEEGGEAHVPPPRAIATVDQPPPNFFASSSSSLPPPPAPVIRGESRKKKPVKGRQVADDAPPPEGFDSDPPKEKSRLKPKKKPRPEPGDAGQSTSVSASASRSRSNAKDPAYKSAEIVEDSDEEGGSLLLPHPPRRPDPESPLSDLSEPTGPGLSKPITPLSGRKRLVPEVVITTAPRKRTSSPFTREVEERGSVDREGVNGSPKGNKRQKRAAGYFDDLEDEVVVVPRKGPKGKGKAPPKGKGRAKPQPKEVVDEGEFEEDPAEDATGTSRKAKNKVKTKATPKRKSGRSGKSRVADLDDEVAITKDSEVVLVDSEQVSDPPMAQQNPNVDEASPPRDAKVSLNFVIDSEIVLMCDFQEDQENTPPPQARQIQPNRHPIRQSLGRPLLPVPRLPFPDSTTVTLCK